MKALTYSRYGPPDVVEISDIPRPDPTETEVLVRIHASTVNTADWRIRAAAFPGILAIPGRLMFGLFRPRNPHLGSEFSGVVEDTGSSVTRFEMGQTVFGIDTRGGASAEYLAIPETSAIAAMPVGLSFPEAAALPFGGLTALVFLADFAKLKAGQTVLIIGASGGVGAYAVQIAKALGASVVGVASTRNQDFVRALGADQTIDYRQTGWDDLSDRFDVILDTVGAITPRQAHRLLRPNGLFLPLNFGVREIGSALLNPFRSRKTRLAVNEDRQEDLKRLSDYVEAGQVRPIIDTEYLLSAAREAHAHVEKRSKRGSIVLIVQEPA